MGYSKVSEKNERGKSSHRIDAFVTNVFISYIETVDCSVDGRRKEMLMLCLFCAKTVIVYKTDYDQLNGVSDGCSREDQEFYPGSRKGEYYNEYISEVSTGLVKFILKLFVLSISMFFRVFS